MDQVEQHVLLGFMTSIVQTILSRTSKVWVPFPCAEVARGADSALTQPRTSQHACIRLCCDMQLDLLQ